MATNCWLIIQKYAESGGVSMKTQIRRLPFHKAAADIFETPLPKAIKNLARQYGLSEVHYQYMKDETANKIIIYWQYS